MVLRTKQIAAFEAEQRVDFYQRMLAHFKEAFPDRITHRDDADLLHWIDRTCQRIDPYGVEQEMDAELYLELALCHPETLEPQPFPHWVERIMQYPGRPGAQKVDMIREELIFGGRR